MLEKKVVHTCRSTRLDCRYKRFRESLATATLWSTHGDSGAVLILTARNLYGSCAVRFSAVRCGAARCGAVRCGAVRCGAVRCGAVRCGAVRCDMVRNGSGRSLYGLDV